MNDANIDALVRLCEIELAVAEQLIHSAGVKAGIKDKAVSEAYWSDVGAAADKVLQRVEAARERAVGTDVVEAVAHVRCNVCGKKNIALNMGAVDTFQIPNEFYCRDCVDEYAAKKASSD